VAPLVVVLVPAVVVLVPVVVPAVPSVVAVVSASPPVSSPPESPQPASAMPHVRRVAMIRIVIGKLLARGGKQGEPRRREVNMFPRSPLLASIRPGSLLRTSRLRARPVADRVLQRRS
jgi:hypothetical protein